MKRWGSQGLYRSGGLLLRALPGVVSAMRRVALADGVGQCGAVLRGGAVCARALVLLAQQDRRPARLRQVSPGPGWERDGGPCNSARCASPAPRVRHSHAIAAHAQCTSLAQIRQPLVFFRRKLHAYPSNPDRFVGRPWFWP